MTRANPSKRMMRDNKCVSINDLSVANPWAKEMCNVREKAKQVNDPLKNKEGPKDFINGCHFLSYCSIFT